MDKQTLIPYKQSNISEQIDKQTLDINKQTYTKRSVCPFVYVAASVCPFVQAILSVYTSLSVCPFVSEWLSVCLSVFVRLGSLFVKGLTQWVDYRQCQCKPLVQWCKQTNKRVEPRVLTARGQHAWRPRLGFVKSSETIRVIFVLHVFREKQKIT